jgi:copper chaperone CopZ
VRAITEEVSVLPGVQQVVVNLGDKSVRVNHEGKVSLNELIKAINEAGYDEVSVLA